VYFSWGGKEGKAGGRGPISSAGPGPPKHVKTALPLKPVDRQMKAIVQERVYHTDISTAFDELKPRGHDKMRSGTDLRGGSPLVSFDHVIDPHFVTFSSSLSTTVSNLKFPNANLTLTLTIFLTLTLTITLQLSLIRAL